MRGESKSGLYTYYIKFLYGMNVFDDIIDRIGEMYLNGRTFINIIGFSKELKKGWKNHYELLTW